MFKKLLSNLPFNPSLIHQVSFYAQRMKKESAVRRTAFVFMALTMLVQLFAAASPSQASVTGSTNDIVWAGFSSPADAAAKCRSNVQNFRIILDYYGLDCTRVANGITTTVSSSDANLDSLGRNEPAAVSPRNGRPSGRYNVNITGVGRLYMKNLSYWDSRGASSYKVLRVTNRYDGRTLWIMYDCGNIITASPYTPPTPPTPPPPAPPPPVVIPKTISCSNLAINVGDNARIKLGRKISVRGQAIGKNLSTSSPHVSMRYDFVDSSGKLLGTQTNPSVAFSGSVADDPQAHEFSSDTSGQYTVKLTVKYDTHKTASGSATGDCLRRVTVDKPCQDVETSEDLERCLDLHKTAANKTQNIANAHNTTAQANDVIQYTLSTKNSGKVTVPKYIIKENMNDVLEYANITDFHGGQLDKDNYIFWPAQDIKPGETIKKLITVKVKDPVPQTPVSSSDPASFDLLMTNTYGDTIDIKLPGSIAKQIEATTTLPSTGPGESIAAGFAITVVIGYFFARSRLFATELTIVRQEYASAGEV